MFSSRVKERLDSTLESNPSVRWCKKTRATPHIRLGDGPPWRVTFDPPQTNVPLAFEVVVLCRGFGTERSVPRKGGGVFRPFSFWADDPYPSYRKVLLPVWSGHLVDRKIAVLGGGDGAIQDALRFMTEGKDARQILNEVLQLAPPQVTNRIVNLIGETDNLERHYACASSSTNLEQDLHSSLLEVTEAIVDSAAYKALSDSIRCHSVGIYFRSPMLGPCYPLNRFLALLFQQLIMKRDGIDIVQPDHQVQEVECLHQASDGCFNTHHKLSFAGTAKTISCLVLVPRLGIEQRPGVCERSNDVRHVLPHWLPNWKPA